MSLLPNDLAPGSTAVIPMLTEAGPTQAFFAPASGGGGGGGGPNLICSTLTAQASIATSSITANVVSGTVGELKLSSGGSGVTTWSGNNGTYISQNNQKVIELNGSVSAPGQCLFNNFNVVNMNSTNLLVSSINGAQPGGAVPEDLTLNSLSTVNLNVSLKGNFNSVNASTITLQDVWPVPLFQNGRFTMPPAASNVVETDVVFTGTDWFASAVYDGAVNSAVSSIGTEVLSRSTFALYAQGGLGVSWMVLGN